MLRRLQRPAAAVGITVLQVLVYLVATGDAQRIRAYRSLAYWDSLHYARILDRGYVSDWPPASAESTVGFFPGYPLFAAAVRAVLGVDTTTSLLLAAQLAAAAVWWYVLVLLDRFHVRGVRAFVVVILLASYPSSFYFVAGYSESLFVAAALGYVHALTSQRRSAWWIAGLHGFVMTATRLFGLPLAGLPLGLLAFDAARGRPWRHRLARALAVTTACAAGALSFFAYCALKFGHWDIYFWRQHLGFQATSDWGALVRPRTYFVCIPTQPLDDWRDPDCLSRSFTAVTGYVLVGVGVAIARVTSRAWHARREGVGPPAGSAHFMVAAFSAAVALFATAVAATAHNEMHSMMRHTLPCFVLAVLTLVPGLRRASDVQLRLLVGAAVVLFVLETMLMYRFGHRIWVA